MKKMLLVVSGLIFCLVFLSCGKKNSPDEVVPGSSGPRAYGAASDGYMLITNLDKSRQIKLTMSGWEGGPSETDNVNNALEKFHSYYPNITVEYTPSVDSGPNHHGKIMTMFAAGAAPDVFYCASDYYDDFAKRKIIYDITDRYLEVYDLDDFIPAAMDCMTYNDRLYGISSCNVSPELYYNKDLFDKAGIAYPSTDPSKPWTWDEFVTIGKALTRKDASGKVTQYGFYGLETVLMTEAYFNQYNISYVNNDKTMFTATDDPNFKRIFQNIKELRTVHGIAPQASFTETSGM
ncbi:MAG: extracellular solute-binding protein, partial [Treponema sp.]|nr:extracellular solute-binding protein [Treponema sp.]